MSSLSKLFNECRSTDGSHATTPATDNMYMNGVNVPRCESSSWEHIHQSCSHLLDPVRGTSRCHQSHQPQSWRVSAKTFKLSCISLFAVYTCVAFVRQQLLIDGFRRTFFAQNRCLDSHQQILQEECDNDDMAALPEGVMSRTVLVTGGAGFIGFHVAQTLSRDQQNRVVVLDNFNNYYGVNLKIDRAYLLHKLGVTVYKMDLCNGSYLHHIMTFYNFSHVIHLAAQAGVRYSVQDPMAYVTTNIECHLVLLETLRHFPKAKLVYASSSSVYGREQETIGGEYNGRADKKTGSVRMSRLFRLTDDVNHPANMYAATKRADELLTDLHCHSHGLRAVGLRFFTVYGPWGRPDMAIFQFTKAIIEHAQLTLFQASDAHPPLKRDFTYVTDAVSGIISALDFKPDSCGRLFNIAGGRSIHIETVIRIIEQELNTTAIVKRVPVPPTELFETWADISEATKHLNYVPVIRLQQGVKLFVEWFKSYQAGGSYQINSTHSHTYHSVKEWFSKL